MGKNGKQIASFIALTVAITTPMVTAQDTYTDELLADASVMIQRPEIVNPTVARYAGPEYFGFGGTVKVVEPLPLPNQSIPKIHDTAQYMQMQNNVLNNTNSNMQINTKADVNTVNINNVKSNTNFINTEYGSVRVLDPAGHYIFK